MNPETLDILLAKHAAGELSAAECDQLDRWAEQSPENRRILDLFKGESTYGRDVAMLFTFDRDRIWNAIVNADRKRTRKKRRLWITGYAAAASIAVGVLVTAVHNFRPGGTSGRNELYSLFEPGHKGARLELADGRVVDMSDREATRIMEMGEAQVEIGTERLDFRQTGLTAQTNDAETYNTLRVPAGAEFMLTLSDGTKVWLNTESSIRFPTTFKKQSRNVELTGEAYFEVARNERQPFVVHSQGQTVTVLGTSFNISAYPDDKSTVTTLVSGSVKLATHDQEFILTPDQQLTYLHDEGRAMVGIVDAKQYSSWTQGMFVFFDEPLESICRKLARWYDVDLDVSSPSLQGIRYSGMIRRHSTFNKIAELMSQTNEIFFREADGKIYVSVIKKKR